MTTVIHTVLIIMCPYKPVGLHRTADLWDKMFYETFQVPSPFGPNAFGVLVANALPISARERRILHLQPTN